MFLVHGDDGDISALRGLAALLGEAMPLYALSAGTGSNGDGGDSSPNVRTDRHPADCHPADRHPADCLDKPGSATLAQMAAAYLREMRGAQPHGPYRLAGLAGGGMLAYEIANQLIGADEGVDFLGMIETPSVFPPEAPSAPAAPDAGGEDARGFQGWLAAALHDYARPQIPVPVTLFAASDASRPDPIPGWQRALGARLTVARVGGDAASLLQGPQLVELAVALAQAMEQCAKRREPAPELRHSARMVIHSGRSHVPPLFCVPGAGASIAAFASLSMALDPGIPLHGLQPRGLCGVMVPHVDVPSAARFYLKAVREVAPRGPYRLLGHSFGGWVVLEMARQLEDAGERVATLVALDTESPAVQSERDTSYTRAETMAKLAELFEMGAEQGLHLTAADFSGLDQEAQLSLLLGRLISAKVMPPRTQLQALRGIVRVFATNLNTAYRPEHPYAGPVHLVGVPDPAELARGISYDPEPLVQRWRQTVPDTRFWRGPGNHMTLLEEPHVKELAAWLNPLLM